MASLKCSQIPVHSFPLFFFFPSPSFIPSHPMSFLAIQNRKKSRRAFVRLYGNHHLVRSSCNPGKEVRPPFDINLAVVLAGFAFEAYSTPPKDVGWHEVDAAECRTVFLSQKFLHEVYDGQLFIKLRKGVDFPAMDPWGTSDPYIIMQLNGQVAKSKVKWATKDPIWNDDFTLNVKLSPTISLQVAAWDANLVTPHKRMGNAEFKLESLCDGNIHEVVAELGGIGGGGKIYLEVKYKSFEEIEQEKQWFQIPFVSDFLSSSWFESALKMAFGSQTINASQFVQAAFGQLQLFNYSNLGKFPSPSGNVDDTEGTIEPLDITAVSNQSFQEEMNPERSTLNLIREKEKNLPDADGTSCSLVKEFDEFEPPDKFFWRNFSGILSQSAFQKLGFSLPEIERWDGLDLLNKMTMQTQKVAEEDYVGLGIATPEAKDADNSETKISKSANVFLPSLMEIKKASLDVLSQTETILGALMVLTANVSQLKIGFPSIAQDEKKKDDSMEPAGYSVNVNRNIYIDGLTLDARKKEQMKELFLSAESAMEAWAMLATSLGRTSFIKSEFEKICFLDNVSTDTQVAMWRDSRKRRLVVAFRGTEQAKWKDLRTDLMLIPSGLNPERLDCDFKQEVQVHSGFLNAYDSVRNRIMTLIKLSISSPSEDGFDRTPTWNVYLTGHSLGGALATLLALELSSSRMAKSGAISVTMYNFGSPRVGNRRFADVYNEKVKDSWRIVNHRDIIPTVPRLMGYCHVAQPVYLAAGELRDALVNMEFVEDGYQGDLIGESTPDALVSEFMKGEKQLVKNILQTEISLLRSIRDGTALMQHMEDFYYITLLESIRSDYKRVDGS